MSSQETRKTFQNKKGTKLVLISVSLVAERYLLPISDVNFRFSSFLRTVYISCSMIFTRFGLSAFVLNFIVFSLEMDGIRLMYRVYDVSPKALKSTKKGKTY